MNTRPAILVALLLSACSSHREVADLGRVEAELPSASTPAPEPAPDGARAVTAKDEASAGGEAQNDAVAAAPPPPSDAPRAEEKRKGDAEAAGVLGGALGDSSVQQGIGGLGLVGTGAGGGGAVGGVGAASVPAKAARGRAPAGYGAAPGLVAPPPAVPQEEVVATSEMYTDHGVNPFTMTVDDRLSTFSIDVDTASYTIARRKLMEEGVLPPESAVRVEEFINFLDYPSYTPPKQDPFAVHMEAMPDPFRDGHHVLRVGVQGFEVDEASRAPVHLTFLVDVSGSMSSADKLPLAKRSLHQLVDRLQEQDTVALATYAGQVAALLPPTSAANKRQIHDAIDRLGAGGSTAMSAGIDLAYEMADRGFVAGHENRVIVLSDGDANVGNSSWDALLGQIKRYADKGITLSTIGFGMGNYKDTLMEQLANKGDGNNFYIDSPAQSQRVFVEQLTSTMLTIARDVKIQVEFDPQSVVAYRLIGYENRDVADRDFRNDRVDAGEVGSGHSVTALYDVILKDGYAPRLATVRLRYEAPGADKAATEKSYPFADRALKERTDLASRDTRIAFASATFAEILRGSPQAAEISMDELLRFAAQAARPGQKDDQELLAMMQRAAQLGAGNKSVARR